MDREFRPDDVLPARYIDAFGMAGRAHGGFAETGRGDGRLSCIDKHRCDTTLFIAE
jgi:hypothetical protein